MGEISPFQVCGSAAAAEGQKSHSFVKMGDLEKGLKKKRGDLNLYLNLNLKIYLKTKLLSREDL